MIERVSTGVPGLDKYINGGFPEGSLSLVTGGPGSGKTTFCIKFVEEGIEKGENCLYITTGQRTEDIKMDAESYGIDLDDENLTIDRVSPSNDVAEDIRTQISNENFDRVVLDSLSVFEMHWGEKDHLRKYINKLMEHFRDIDGTVVVTSERPGDGSSLSRMNIAEYIVDGVIKLEGYALGETTYRSLQVVKMRRTNIDGSILDMNIDENGISVEESETL
jgi:KaiC/GvpD/RAD55 family RecA-like ATPase